MERLKKLLNTPLKFGHGLHRARKNDHKHTRDLKHEKKWIEQKMDNK